MSVQAPLSGGEFSTRPCRSTGSALTLNDATSAAGSVRVEIQGPEGRPIQGYSLADIVGAMHATWEDRYEAMEVWARKAWGNRPR